MATSAPRLPGLRFETARPPSPPDLPRMDVAAFVGFASAGPVGVPVAVDDEVRFRELFGPDLPLAWDVARGEMTYAHLAPAVREFFRNGGRRCWIVRVADESTLEASVFRIPGLLHGRGRAIDAAYLLASSPGSWADGISLNAALVATHVAPSAVTVDRNGMVLSPESTSLLRLAWNDGTVAFFLPHPGADARDIPAAERTAAKARHFSHAYWFRPVPWDELDSAGDAVFLAGSRQVPLDALQWKVVVTDAERSLQIRLHPLAARGIQPGCWIRARLDGFGSPAPGGVIAHMAPSPKPGGGNQGGGNQGGGNQGGGNQGGGNQGGGNQGGGNQGGGNQGGGNQGGGNQGGGNNGGGNDGNNGGGPKETTAFLLVDNVIREADETIVVVRQAWRTLHHARAWKEIGGEGFDDAALLMIELWSRRADGTVVRLPDVGLVPGHPRFLGAFPPDQVLFAPTQQLTESTTDLAGSDLSVRRMQLAAVDSGTFAASEHGAMQLLARDAANAPKKGRKGGNDDHGTGGEDDDDSGGGFQAYLPLGVPSIPREDFYQAAYTSGRAPLERDGVGTFSPDLFLDPLLSALPAERLLDEAFHNAYVAQPPRPPVRMHALLPVEEVSLLAVPDAVHTGWRLNDEEAPPAAPEAPTIIAVAQPDAEGHIHAEWTPVPGALGYTLEDSPDPRFRSGVHATETPQPGRVGTRAIIVRPRPCPDRLYFRVRARTRAGRSGWSATARLDRPEGEFDPCGAVALDAPLLDEPTTSGPAADGRLSITWRAAPEAPDVGLARQRFDRVFRVESSPDPAFALPQKVYEGSGTKAEMWKPLSGTLYFRAASWLREKAGPHDPPPCIGEESPWSPVRKYEAPVGKRWETITHTEDASPPHEGAALAIHQAMLRFCAARSDCFSVLALPRHFREAQALAHVGALTTALTGGAADTATRSLSFGALYHPWTVVRTPVAAAPMRAIPPDGATCGVMASRANLDGAWAAPANKPLDGVALLDPRLPENVRAAFLGKRVNAVAPFPRGFMSWSEETLSDDAELRGVGVRRLMILLRRLALREGDTYVFEPNDPSFRRMVQRQFDAILGNLYVRGAFAGATHQEGYRVVTDDTVNPPENVDLGRLVIELRVAPSRPLAFLTVRLVQTGAGLTVQEG